MSHPDYDEEIDETADPVDEPDTDDDVPVEIDSDGEPATPAGKVLLKTSQASIASLVKLET